MLARYKAFTLLQGECRTGVMEFTQIEGENTEMKEGRTLIRTQECRSLDYEQSLVV